MTKTFANSMTTGLFTALALLAWTAPHAAWSASEDDPREQYDRLDGQGRSGKKVHVVEWEGNLEVHVYPAGSLKGLGLKLEEKDKNRKVMVISYRFDNEPKPLIRRAILGIPMGEGFKAYRDRSADDYDKIVISNNGLAISKTLVEFALDAQPKQLYPDGHPALAGDAPSDKAREDSKKIRVPAQSQEKRQLDDFDEDSGTIKPFRW
jgi:hypothetical protein